MAEPQQVRGPQKTAEPKQPEQKQAPFQVVLPQIDLSKVSSLSIGPIQTHDCGPNCPIHGSGSKNPPPITLNLTNVKLDGLSGASLGPIETHECGPDCPEHGTNSKKNIEPLKLDLSAVNLSVTAVSLGPIQKHECGPDCPEHGTNSGKKDVIIESPKLTGLNLTDISAISLGPIQTHECGPDCPEHGNKSKNKADVVIDPIRNFVQLGSLEVPLSNFNLQQGNQIFIKNQTKFSQNIVDHVSAPVTIDLNQISLPIGKQQNLPSESTVSLNTVEPTMQRGKKEKISVQTEKAIELPVQVAVISNVSKQITQRTPTSQQQKYFGYTYLEIITNAELRRRYGYLFGISAEVEETQVTNAPLPAAIEEKKIDRNVTAIKTEVSTTKQSEIVSAKVEKALPQLVMLRPSRQLIINEPSVKAVIVEIVKLKTEIHKNTDPKAIAKAKTKLRQVELEIKKTEIELKKAVKEKRITPKQLKEAKLQLQKLKTEVKLLKKEIKNAERKIEIFKKRDIKINQFLTSVKSGKPNFLLLNKMTKSELKRLLERLRKRKIVRMLLMNKKRTRKKSIINKLIDKIKSKLGL